MTRKLSVSLCAFSLLPFILFDYSWNEQLLKKKEKRGIGGKIISGGGKLYFLCFIFCFHLLWGFNYYRQPLFENE
jgi:hypothetical protein